MYIVNHFKTGIKIHTNKKLGTRAYSGKNSEIFHALCIDQIETNEKCMRYDNKR